MSGMKGWIRAVRRDVLALWIAARDPRVPWPVKLFAAAVAAYALSPVDLIPDFVPVLGYLDDLIIVPAGLFLAVRLIPIDLLAEFRAQADRMSARPTSRAGLAIIVSIWIAVAAGLSWWAWSRLIA